MARVQSVTNQQNAAVLGTWTTGGGSSSVAGSWGNGYGVNLDLLQYIKTQLTNQVDVRTNAQGGVAPPPGWKTTKFVVEKLVMKQELKNQTNSAVHLTLYDCVLRSGIDVNALDTPLNMWFNGMADQNESGVDATGGVGTINNVGLTPFRSKRFTKNWRVFSTKRLVLHPGHTHIHTTRVAPRNSWSLDMDFTGNTGGADLVKMIPGVTTCTFAVVYGTICNDATATGNVGYGPAAVDSICRSYCEFRLIEKSGRVDQQFMLYPAITTAKVQPEDDAAMATTVTMA